MNAIDRLRRMAETWPTNTPEHQTALFAADCVAAVVAFGEADLAVRHDADSRDAALRVSASFDTFRGLARRAAEGGA